MRVLSAIAILILSLSLPLAAWAQDRRVALVIGNDAYKDQPPLKNPVADAQSITATLKRIGFKVDQPLLNASRQQMLDALLTFADRARDADIALVYFAGHGLQLARDGVAENYLVPVDAKLSDARRVPDETVSLGRILRELSDARVLVVLLDACRDNPAAVRMGGQGTRAVLKRGLERLPEDVGRGALVAYAAAPGAYAQDGPAGGNSPFATALVHNIPQPGVDIVRVMERVADDVEHATHGGQQPEVMSRLRRKDDIYLTGLALPVSPTPPASLSANGSTPATDCDRLGQPPRSVMGRVPAFADGVSVDRLDATAAAAACAKAMQAFPGEARFAAFAGRAAYKAGNFIEAVRLYKLSADQGNATAQSNLGVMYQYGQGVVKNEEEALRLYKLAADQGFALGQSNLGFMYQYGQGVAKNEGEALRLYKLAADQGNARSQSNLGVMYQYGQGVAKNEGEALRLYKLAADQGNAQGQAYLGTMYENGHGVAKNEGEAVRLYKLAADQGDATGQAYLGTMYGTGRGVEKDESEAVRLYKLAADQGDARSQNNLGVMYESGRGVAKDEREAVRLFKLATAQGFATGQANLGVMYENGRGVTKDEHEAVRLYRLAAAQGDDNAKAALRRRGEVTP